MRLQGRCLFACAFEFDLEDVAVVEVEVVIRPARLCARPFVVALPEDFQRVGERRRTLYDLGLCLIQTDICRPSMQQSCNAYRQSPMAGEHTSGH